MASAAVLHLVRGEFGELAVVVVLGALAYFVAWGRFKLAPIARRESDGITRLHLDEGRQSVSVAGSGVDEVSAMTSDRTILVTGSDRQSGRRGRARAAGHRVSSARPDAQAGQRAAAALARQGVDVVKGDLDDEATLRSALAGAWGVFGVQNAAEAGRGAGRGAGQASCDAGARGRRRTLRLHIRGIGAQADGHPALRQTSGASRKRTRPPLPSHVILRPVFFMENLLAPFSLQGSTLAWALGRTPSYR